jgi:hypothetical protein
MLAITGEMEMLRQQGKAVELPNSVNGNNIVHQSWWMANIFTNQEVERILAPWEENPYGVVSLLAMLELHARYFVHSLTRFAAYEIKCGQESEGNLVTPVALTQLHTDIVSFQKECVYYGFKSAAQQCGRIVKSMEDSGGKILCRSLQDDLRDLRKRLEDELSSELFFHLSLAEAKFYSSPHDGWDEVTTRFPKAVVDIEECSKCFAFNRYPASVFHAMQVVEHGLIALGKFLELKDPKSGWTAVCRELQRITKGDYSKLSPNEKKHFPFLEQVHATTEALKNAWRNKIDHAMNRLILLPGILNDEIANEIIVASRSFMRRLAAELPRKTINER